MARSIIVTGSSRGIGKALAGALVRRGDDVTLTARGGDELARAAEELGALGPGTAEGVQLDATDREGTAALVADVVRRRGRLDMIINNAGINMAGLVDDLDGSHFDAVIDVNLRGVVNGVLAAYPVMLAEGKGQIVNVSSLAGVVPSPGFAAYAMAKAGVTGLTVSLRVEAAPRGIRVNLLCPGIVETQMIDTAIPDGLPPVNRPFQPRAMLIDTLRDTPMSADAFAEAALRQIDADRAVIVIPASAARFHSLYRHLPVRYDKVARKRMPQTLAKLDAQRVPQA
jgi:NAD(P)-dependent dehydrogenase (short-subunit alcohol dehydrogenase family)